ncbi:alpha/beta hydrolase [Macrococcoides canis]|uniref:Alpha/beta hydrolase n=1 Tax=Macrococcoides canis TaxID=1855823 RepID=A0A4R6C5A0_9STAP|nr:alpha/beta hydrolase [Macrococcus canis]MEE1107777.1 alpha/beta hydrolase [Macrococcus canis]TDM17044.1 alpha/beta hydrolase [Macrococcus canis]TDM20206.1 alpha/beta hydrolase [Macrococcus canis]TDM23002.1 alpha/beta hydrolase [Macrococcus canis]TDM30989.1 alpha/beta hydrolase [Macrococcus canis]
MKHVINKRDNDTTLLLLHGTGGNEHDMLPLAGLIDSEANVLSVRGNVSEHGMPRFFRRIAEGVFDEEDLVNRTHELNDFITTAASENGLDREKIIAVGYSNGANIAASLMYHDKDALHAAVLFHPMVPLRKIELPDLSDKKVFIGAGVNDPISPKEETEELAKALKNAGAEVEIYWHQSGHSLTQDEVQQAAAWYKAL